MEVASRIAGTEYDRVLLWQLFLVMVFSKCDLLFFLFLFVYCLYTILMFSCCHWNLPRCVCVKKLMIKKGIEFNNNNNTIVTKTVISPAITTIKLRLEIMLWGNICVTLSRTYNMLYQRCRWTEFVSIRRIPCE